MDGVYRRGKYFWFDFQLDCKRYRQSTRLRNKEEAKKFAAAFRGNLVKRGVGIVQKKNVPTLTEFAARFMETISSRHENKPRTVRYYADKLARVLDFEPLANIQIDRIDEQLIESFVQHRRKSHCLISVGRGENRKRRHSQRLISVAEINRELAVLRRALRLGYEWKLVSRIPRIRLLSGERNREFVLSYKDEPRYLGAAPPLLKDVATLLLDTGLRVGEATALLRSDIHLEPVSGSKYGYLQVRDGKTKNAKRYIPLTSRAQAMLTRRCSESTSAWLFAGDNPDVPMLVTSLGHAHAKLRRELGFTKDFVLHSLRHTFLTRLGASGADAFTIMRIAGHSSVTVSQRYIHPTPETVERAFERLERIQEAAKVEPVQLPERKSFPSLPIATVPLENTVVVTL